MTTVSAEGRHWGRRTRCLPSGWHIPTSIRCLRWGLVLMCCGRTCSTAISFGRKERPRRRADNRYTSVCLRNGVHHGMHIRNPHLFHPPSVSTPYQLRVCSIPTPYLLHVYRHGGMMAVIRLGCRTGVQKAGRNLSA